VTRAVAVAQIVVVLVGTFATVGALERLGIGMGGARFPAATGLVLHVAILAIVSVALSLVVLREDRVRALSLERQPRARVVFFTLVGGAGTFVVNACVVGVYVALSGGISHEAGIAKEKAAALSALATIPIWVTLPLAIVAGVYEEIVFRGFLLGRLRLVMATKKPIVGDILAIAVSSFIFGLGHLYQGALGVVQTMFAGVCLAVLVVISKSLWPSILTHAGIDATSLVVVHLISPVVNKVLEGLPA
jgi:membrane protease YdiL (CAAX protease family)